MPYGFGGLIGLAYFVVMLLVALVIARFILIRVVRLVRREWTRPEPPRN